MERGGGEGGEKEALVSWCLVPFSRALIICIDRASFVAKTCLNSAATGSVPRLLPGPPFHGISKDANDRRLIYSCVIFTSVSIPSLGPRYDDRCHPR